MKNNIVILEKNKCVGCHSCEQSCPTACITMVENTEGFYHPVVSKDCTSCGLCIKKCPILTPRGREDFFQETYGLILKDTSMLARSSSGGIFAGAAAYVLEQGGVVFGCAFDDAMTAVHIAVTEIENLYKLQGSKYVASNTNNTFSLVRNYLLSKKLVLYSGCPCQIAGLRAFLGKSYTNLFTVDLVCHGTPSQKLFSKYLEWLGVRYKEKVLYYGFRDKDVGGWNCGGKTKTKTKTKTINCVCDPYFASFLRGETYREACYTCGYSNMNRVGDITIGDFWGVEKFYPEVNTKNGVSLCIINTKKGKYLFEAIRKNFLIFNCSINEIIADNLNLKQPSPRPDLRNSIYYNLDKLNVISYFKTIKYENELCFFLKKFLVKILPKEVRQIIKRMIK